MRPTRQVKRSVRSARPVYGVARAQPVRSRRPSRKLGVRLGAIPRRFVVLAVLGLLAVLGIKQVFTVSQIAVAAGTNTEQVRDATRDLIGANGRQGNLLTADTGALADELLAAQPALKTATIKRQWPNGLSVAVTLKQPALGWSSGNQAYLLDHDGTAIGALPAGSDLPVVVDGSNLPVKVGDRVTGTRFITYVGDIISQLGTQKIGVTRLEIKDTTIDLYVTTDKGYRLILDTARPAADAVGDLSAVLATLAASKQAPKEYVDLRIEQRAYYK